MKPDAWMPFYVGDYMRDTGHLTTLEHGAYLLMLMQAWTRGGLLPADERRLRVITKMDQSEWDASRDTLLEFFYSVDGGLRHKRVDHELEVIASKSEKGRAGGVASGVVRRTKSNPGRTRDEPGANQTRTRDEPGTNPERTWSEPQANYVQSQSQEEAKLSRIPESPRATPMPRVSDPPAKWLHLSPTAEIDDDMVTHAVVGGWYIDVAARLVCEAANINEANWRGDWRPLMAWLDDGIDLYEQILPAIRRVAARAGYEPPRSMGYFDQAVREQRRVA